MAFECFSANEGGSISAGRCMDAINGTKRFTLGTAGLSFSSLRFYAGNGEGVVGDCVFQDWVRRGLRVFRLFIKGSRRDVNVRVLRVVGEGVVVLHSEPNAIFHNPSGGGVLSGEGFCPAAAVFRLASSGLY